ncbi:MAG: hypothetical protein A2W99_15245 [Bacteroidetes bacterium GWF2_33_16]|nr:MAG: hypothetical protein A2X00_09455 [Bacteroidetes bacterium GWE2_32_14]OFY07679.1 MAG: hypothetical protein A2W99_15245 [Bacteroidetes bacterium GWF2_33_16]
MPYRRLPNTDSSRLKAIKTAYKKGKEINPMDLAFKQSTFQRVQSFLPKWEKVITEHKTTYDIQVKNNKEYLKKFKKAKLYISHFIQVVNMAIVRGELQPSVRGFYGLDEDFTRLPILNTESDVIDWGKKIIDGEMNRKMQGLTPITNPTIAVVRVHYDHFVEAYKFQKMLQKNHGRALTNLSELRADADDIILNVWNDVEDFYRDQPEDIKREKAQDYGLVYVFRKNEIGRISLFRNADLRIN